MATSLPPGDRRVSRAASRTGVGISPPRRKESPVPAGRNALYRDVMPSLRPGRPRPLTRRASPGSPSADTRIPAGRGHGTRVPGLRPTLTRDPGHHAVAVFTGPAGGALGAACWLLPVLTVGLLLAGAPGVFNGAGRALLAIGVVLAAPWLARGVSRADEAAGLALLGPSRSEE